MRDNDYSENQVRAIKRIQGLSYNDPDFQANTASNLSFSDVVSCGLWSLSDLEEMGSAITRNSVQRERSYTFHVCSGKREPRKRMQKISGEQQILYKARSLNKRDGWKSRW